MSFLLDFFVRTLDFGQLFADSSYQLKGNFIFADDQFPDGDVKVQLYVKGWFGRRYELGSTYTNAKGQFDFSYSWKPWLSTQHQVILEIFEERHPFKHKGLNGYEENILLQSVELNLDNASLHHDVGNFPLNYADIPADLSKSNFPAPNDRPSLNYYWRLFKASFPELLKDIAVRFFQNYLTIQQVQRIYDAFGPQYTRQKATPNHLIDDLLNHICAVDYEKKEDGRIEWVVNWDGLEFDEERSLPNVVVHASPDIEREGYLKLDQIEIQFREDDAAKIITPDSDQIEWAIYLARSAFALKGEAEIHLAEGHLLPGIAAKTFFKYIKPKNPLYPVIAPHFAQLDFINWLGSKGVIFGKGSVLEASSLSESSTAEIIIRGLKQKANYLDYSPPDPLCKNHHRAKACQLHHGILLNFFRDYIAAHREEIQKYQEALYYWSESMHGKLEDVPRFMTSPDQFGDDEVENLARCLAMLVNQTTFLHWSAHTQQTMLTHIDEVTLCPSNFSIDSQGNFDPYGNTQPSKANQQLKIARTLLNFEAHRLKDYAHPDLIERIMAQREHYLPFDVDQMFVATEI